MYSLMNVLENIKIFRRNKGIIALDEILLGDHCAIVSLKNWF